MKTKHKKELNKIKHLMMQSLQEVNKNGIGTGDFVCQEDILDKNYFDTHFTVCGEDTDVAYLVMILKVDL